MATEYKTDKRYAARPGSKPLKKRTSIDESNGKAKVIFDDGEIRTVVLTDKKGEEFEAIARLTQNRYPVVGKVTLADDGEWYFEPMEDVLGKV